MNTTDDRRAHRRVGTERGLGWQVELHTYDPEGVRIDLRGEVRSASRNGVLIHIRRELEVGTACLVHFLGADDRVAPAYAIGRIARVDPNDEGLDVAVHFEKPLHKLEPPD